MIRNPEALEMFEEASDDNVEEEEEAQGPSEDEEDPVEEEVKSEFPMLTNFCFICRVQYLI